MNILKQIFTKLLSLLSRVHLGSKEGTVAVTVKVKDRDAEVESHTRIVNCEQRDGKESK